MPKGGTPRRKSSTVYSELLQFLTAPFVRDLDGEGEDHALGSRWTLMRTFKARCPWRFSNCFLSATPLLLLPAGLEYEQAASTPWQRRSAHTLLLYKHRLSPPAVSRGVEVTNPNLPQPALEHQPTGEIPYFSTGRKREGSFREPGCSQLAVISSSVSD